MTMVKHFIATGNSNFIYSRGKEISLLFGGKAKGTWNQYSSNFKITAHCVPPTHNSLKSDWFDDWMVVCSLENLRIVVLCWYFNLVYSGFKPLGHAVLSSLYQSVPWNPSNPYFSQHRLQEIKPLLYMCPLKSYLWRSSEDDHVNVQENLQHSSRFFFSMLFFCFPWV